MPGSYLALNGAVAVPSSDSANLISPVLSYEFGFENPTTIGSGSGGAGTGRAKFREVKIVKPVNEISINLARMLGFGGHYTTVVLGLMAKPTDTIPIVEYQFNLVFISSITAMGNVVGGELPWEQITLAYGSLGMVVRTGQTPMARFIWNQVTNQSIP